MTKAIRLLIATGEWFRVECAVRADLSSPAEVFLERLEHGDLGEPGGGGGGVRAELSLDEQVDSHAWVLAASARIASTGRPPHGRSFNQLNHGIWELKHRSIRVAFFDTDGTGADVPLIDREVLFGFAARE